METAIAELGTGIYTSYDAAKILRIPPSKSSYWFRYYAKSRLVESIGFQYNFDMENVLAVNFLTLVEMYIFYVLKDEIGMNSRNIVKYHSILSKELNTYYPFACGNLIYAEKKNLIFEDKGRFKNADDLRQTFIEEFVLPFYKKITFDDSYIAQKFHPLGKDKSIVVDPEHQFGKPIIDGTNIYAEVIYDYYLGGDSKDLIADLFEITVENVQDVITFSEAA